MFKDLEFVIEKQSLGAAISQGASQDIIGQTRTDYVEMVSSGKFSEAEIRHRASPKFYDWGTSNGRQGDDEEVWEGTK